MGLFSIWGAVEINLAKSVVHLEKVTTRSIKDGGKKLLCCTICLKYKRGENSYFHNNFYIIGVYF